MKSGSTWNHGVESANQAMVRLKSGDLNTLQRFACNAKQSSHKFSKDRFVTTLKLLRSNSRINLLHNNNNNNYHYCIIPHRCHVSLHFQRRSILNNISTSYRDPQPGGGLGLGLAILIRSRSRRCSRSIA